MTASSSTGGHPGEVLARRWRDVVVFHGIPRRCILGHPGRPRPTSVAGWYVRMRRRAVRVSFPVSREDRSDRISGSLAASPSGRVCASPHRMGVRRRPISPLLVGAR